MAKRFFEGAPGRSAVFLGVFVGFLAVAAFAGTSEFDPNATVISEEKTPEPHLKFKYRLVPDAKVVAAEVAADGTVIESRATPYADNALNLSAMLVLVDTSVGTAKLPRAATIEANKQIITDILNKAQPRNLIGVSTFANDLVELTPVGAPFSDSRAAVAKLKADGMGTRLYRRAMDAIEKLAAVKADRKALLIFSDGKDEDTGYTLANLQEAANKAKIMVLAVGCPESAQDIPALGNLERLAAESAGFYAQLPLAAQPGGARPPNDPALAQALIAAIDGGGEVVASLKDVAPDAKVTVTLTTNSGQKLEQILERVPLQPDATPTPEASVTPEATPTPEPTPAVTPAPTPTPTKMQAAAAWAQQNKGWVIAGAVALLGLLAIIIAAVATRKKPASPPADFSFDDPPLPGAAQNAALAFLVMQDAEGSRLAITKTASRIGRRSDNDIVFSNDSVSGHHAELHMSRDGAFSITDLGSGNGVVLNGKKVAQSGLRDGDLVELGEVRFRFALAQ